MNVHGHGCHYGGHVVSTTCENNLVAQPGRGGPSSERITIRLLVCQSLSDDKKSCLRMGFLDCYRRFQEELDSLAGVDVADRSHNGAIGSNA